MIRSIEGQPASGKGTVGIVVSRFNSVVTSELLSGALDCLSQHGVKESSITVVHCPGAFEIPQVAMQLVKSKSVDTVICLGCIIRGETPHFEYIASAVAHGVNRVALDTGTPVTFGVLTTETLEQALARAGDKADNKGWEAALAALELANVGKQLSEGRRPSGH